MNITISNALKRWVEDKVDSGQYPSEEAVVVAALVNLQGQEASPALEDLVDLDFVAYCAREGDENVTLEEARRATSKVPGSMAEAIIEDERADRF